MNRILYIALLVSILTYNLWSYFPKGFFYIGNAIFIFLLCFYIFIINNKNFITFVLMALSISNLFDELIFDPLTLNINEFLFAIFIICFWDIKKLLNAR
jgi:hypothetical protein